jgi:hypothetical protein
MPKGSFTQSAIILLDGPVSTQSIASCLNDFDIVRTLEDSDDNKWMCGPGLSLARRPDVNGYVVVDAFDQQWPDHTGDAKEQWQLFGAWTMGWFGPFTYPGNLQRAAP